MNDMVDFIEPLIPALRRCARAMVRDRQAADDLVQDRLERVISHWHQRRAEGDLRSWVFAILLNLMRSLGRRAARRPIHVALEDAQAGELA